jgi:hypothetical protein
MFILMNAWSELNQLKDAPNFGGIQPGCSNPSFGELVMIGNTLFLLANYNVLFRPI